MANENAALRQKLARRTRQIQELEIAEDKLCRHNQSRARLLTLLVEHKSDMESDLELTERLLEKARVHLENLQNHGSCRKTLQKAIYEIDEATKSLTLKHNRLSRVCARTSLHANQLSQVVDECAVILAEHLMGLKRTTDPEASQNEQSLLPEVLALLTNVNSGPVKDITLPVS